MPTQREEVPGTPVPPGTFQCQQSGRKEKAGPGRDRSPRASDLTQSAQQVSPDSSNAPRGRCPRSSLGKRDGEPWGQPTGRPLSAPGDQLGPKTWNLRVGGASER